MGKWRLIDMVLAVALSREFGADNKEMQATIRRVRQHLVREQQPLASKLMRHDRIELWLDIMLAEYAEEWRRGGYDAEVPPPRSGHYDIEHLIGEVKALCKNKPGSFVWAEVGPGRRYNYSTIMAAQRRGLITVKAQEGVYYVYRPDSSYKQLAG